MPDRHPGSQSTSRPRILDNRDRQTYRYSLHSADILSVRVGSVVPLPDGSTRPRRSAASVRAAVVYLRSATAELHSGIGDRAFFETTARFLARPFADIAGRHPGLADTPTSSELRFSTGTKAVS
jgi:hypothetical protein